MNAKHDAQESAKALPTALVNDLAALAPFQCLARRYLVDPVACTPACGWEKGQVENQVGLVPERFFTRLPPSWLRSMPCSIRPVAGRYIACVTQVERWRDKLAIALTDGAA